MTPDKAEQTDKTATREPKGRGRAHARSRVGHLGMWSLAGVVVLAVAFSLVIVIIIDQTMRAPDWVRARVEARIEQNLNGLQIDFGDVQLVINKGWRPRLRLRDVSLSGPDGLSIVQLSNAEVSLAMRPLLQGQVQPKQITLSGASAVLRRDAQGTVSLELGSGAGAVNEAASLPQLIETLDNILVAPQLGALTNIEMSALSLRWEDARTGQALTLDGGAIRMDRTGDQLRLAASFALLSGGDQASFVELNYASRIGEINAAFGATVKDIEARTIAAQSVGLAWLKVLRAPISGALRGSIDDKGVLGPLSATLRIGSGVLQPNDQARPIPFSGARSYFSYDPLQQVLEFDELSVSSDWGTGLAEGRAYLGEVENGLLSEMIGQFSFSNLSLNPDGLYDAPLLIQSAIADFRLQLDPFELSLGQMLITDAQSRMHLAGSLKAGAAGWSAALDGEIDQLATGRLETLWPQGAAPKPRDWVLTNLTGGDLRNADFALRLNPAEPPRIYADFEYADATIRFLKTMPPITRAFGQASLINGRFVTTATSGQVVPDQGGPIDISGTSFIIPDIGIKKAAPGIVRLRGTGQVTSVMSLLNRPPLAVLKDTPLPVDLAQGRADVTGTLALPLKDRVQFDEIEFHLSGQITQVESTRLVPGQTISAPRLEVRGDQGELVIAGQGQIGSVPAQVRWRQPLGKGVGKSSLVTGTLEVSDRLIETFSIGLPPGSVSGTGQGRFELALGPDAPPQLDFSTDLAGVGLRIAALGWSKPPAATGLLELEGRLGAVARIDRLELQAAGLSASGSVTTRDGGGLDRALFGTVRLSDWLDAPVELVGTGNGPPDIRVLGGTIDLRGSLPTAGGSGGAASGALRVALDRLQVTDTIALTDFRAQFGTAGGLSGAYEGRVNGQTRVTGQLSPAAGRSAVRIQSQDAGGVFRSSGLLQQARGGALDLTLQPVTGQGPGQFDGTLRVTNTQIQDAPAMAALLNAISLIGLFDELSGQGIQFSEVDAKFRLSPSKLVLYESSATGPSIGLSMDGEFDVGSGTLDMQGVISPIYMLNSIGSFLTRKGEGLIGFNYTLTGAAQSPTVQVNPLTALAPGMLREIFRQEAPRPEGAPEPPRRTPRRAPDPTDGSEGGR